MDIISSIFTQNILPIFLLIAAGFLLGKLYKIEMTTLTRINLCLFVPAFTFRNLYVTAIGSDALKALGFSLSLLLVLLGVAVVVGRLLRLPLPRRKAFQNAVAFYNSGNIGIPLVTLVFATAPAAVASLALATQVMVLVVQNITTNTLGYYNASAAKHHWTKALGAAFRMPTVYAVPLAFLCKALPFQIQATAIWPALDLLSNGLVPIALVTLGVQLTQSRFRLNDRTVPLALLLRLVGAPLLAFVLLRVWGIQGVVAQTLLMTSAVPTAVNTALIAVDCKNEADFATQVVVSSTLLCAITLIGVIALAQQLFPV